MNNNYPYVPLNAQPNVNFLKKVALSVNFLMNGKSNNTGEVTLTPSSTTTVVSNQLCNENSVILLMPMTENAAGKVSHIVTDPNTKSFTITHLSDSHTDKTFRYVIIG